MEQPRRKIRGNDGPHRRLNMPQAKPHPTNAIFKDAFGGAKIGKKIILINELKIFKSM